MQARTKVQVVVAAVVVLGVVLAYVWQAAALVYVLVVGAVLLVSVAVVVVRRYEPAEGWRLTRREQGALMGVGLVVVVLSVAAPGFVGGLGAVMVLSGFVSWGLSRVRGG